MPAPAAITSMVLRESEFDDIIGDNPGTTIVRNYIFLVAVHGNDQSSSTRPSGAFPRLRIHEVFQGKLLPWFDHDKVVTPIALHHSFQQY